MSERNGDGTFKAGFSGNPRGRPALPAELAAVKKLTPSYIRMVISKLSRMNRQEMLSYLESGANNMELMVASIIVKATTEGDHAKLNFLLDRSIGKVVEEKRVQLEPVVYKTTVRGDGALVQEVVAEALGEELNTETPEKEKA